MSPSTAVVDRRNSSAHTFIVRNLSRRAPKSALFLSLSSVILVLTYYKLGSQWQGNTWDLGSDISEAREQHKAAKVRIEREKEMKQRRSQSIEEKDHEERKIMNPLKSSKETNFGFVISGQQSILPHVSLSPGKHKYVLVRAENEGETLWFVKSASPEECGGAYHKYVAKQLVKDLKSLRYKVEVTGGGRIEYDEERQKAHIYGYSNRYGKGDHIKAASIVKKFTNIEATYDLSDDLY